MREKDKNKLPEYKGKAFWTTKAEWFAAPLTMTLSEFLNTKFPNIAGSGGIQRHTAGWVGDKEEFIQGLPKGQLSCF